MAGRTPSTARDFRKHREGVDLTLPSGLRCKARRVGMQTLLKSGTIPNSLMPIVQDALKQGRRGQQFDGAVLLKDLNEERMTEYMATVDAIICEIVTAPQILPVPMRCETCGKLDRDHQDIQEKVSWVALTDEERETEFGEDAAFIDWIDETDKVFLFAWTTGGTADAEKFRGEFTQFVGDLLPGEDVPGQAEQPVGS